MKTLTLSLLLLALTACTANSIKSSTPQSVEEKATKVAETTPSAPNSSDAVTDAQAQKETPAKKKPKGPKGTPAQAAKNCICVKMWMPVCGQDNKTYGNSCEADCAGKTYTQGACEIKK